MRICTALLSLMICGVSLAVEYDRAAFHNAFLHAEMRLWHDYIVQEDTSDLERLLDLEYSYIAWASTQPLSDNKERLAAFGRHIDSYAAGRHNASELNAYISGYHAYSLSMGVGSSVRNGVQALKYGDMSLVGVPTARALMNMGFLYFYRPRWMGGDKQKALDYLRQAAAMYEHQGDTADNWNYTNTNMHIRQCIDKLK